jgi:hypothetical protein
MTTNFRLLCVELLDWVERASDLHNYEAHDLMDRTRAALEAEPEGEWPRREEVLAALRPLYGDQTAADMGAEDDLRTAHVVLARWGHSAPQAPMSEALDRASDRCFVNFPEVYAECSDLIEKHDKLLEIARRDLGTPTPDESTC